jgi:hypothetical protein
LIDFFEVGIEGEVLEDVSLGLKTDLNVRRCTLERKSTLVYSLSGDVICLVVAIYLLIVKRIWKNKYCYRKE